MDAVGKGESGMSWESSSGMYALPCVRQIGRGKLLYNTESSAWRSAMTQRGGVGQ